MEVNSSGELIRYSGTSEEVRIPDGITRIGRHAFNGSKHVKRVIIPDTVEAIGYAAFGHSGLTEIFVPDSVTSIEYGAFEYCEDLRSAVLPDNLECICFNTFKGCRSLKYVRLPLKLRKVENNAFERSGVTGLILPDGLRHINERAFQYMEELTEVRLPRTLRSIGEDAFSFCYKLREIKIPKGTLKIERCAFDACTELARVSLPDTLIELSPSAFSRTKVSNSAKLRELCKKVNSSEPYPLRDGEKELEFNGLNLYYSREEVFDKDSYDLDRIREYSLSAEITDTLFVYKKSTGEKALMLYKDIPTFDSGDREWDSYRKMFLLPEGESIVGVMVCGGYKIAKVVVYGDIRFGDARTERILRMGNVF